MAEDRLLPGWPKKRLVKDVRRHLRTYGIRPMDSVWQATWTWASAIARSYYRTVWPVPSEIAAQYVFLLLHQMRQYHNLKLPCRANDIVPEEVRQLVLSAKSENDANERLQTSNVCLITVEELSNE